MGDKFNARLAVGLGVALGYDSRVVPRGVVVVVGVLACVGG